MATVVYLDVEDEITSAAARIRNAPESRVALVLPYGSRLATSRMNFRLLEREALVNGKRLDVIAPDASARALAASAGLPVFASVVEHEAALAAPEPESVRADGGEAAPPAVADAGEASPLRPGRRPRAARNEAAPAAVPPTAVAPVVDAPAREGDRAAGEPRVVHARRRFRPRAGVVIGLGVLALALLVAGVAAWLVLPTAEIRLTPRLETIGPISVTVHADPAATAVDAEAGVIPATTITIPVRSSGEFAATGKRVEQTAATGGVRWSNCDPTRAYTIPRGTIVRTADNVRFRIDEEVFLPVAVLSGAPESPQITCQSSDVAVTATDPGPKGNVAAGKITVVPSSYNRNVVRVTNPAATSGGSRKEFPRVVQADIDGAMEQLRKDLESQFATELEHPAGVPEGATVFPGTATLGEPRTDVDPATLLNQEVEGFALQMAADGTVQAVNQAPLQAIAEARLEGSVDDGYDLVEGSSVVEVGDATVVGGVIQFPVRGWAQERRPLDAAALARSVLGLSREEAAARLQPYGDVEIDLWPDWVSTVPTFQQRVSLTVLEPRGEALPTPRPATEPPASDEPSAGDGGSEPVPSSP